MYTDWTFEPWTIDIAFVYDYINFGSWSEHMLCEFDKELNSASFVYPN